MGEKHFVRLAMAAIVLLSASGALAANVIDFMNACTAGGDLDGPTCKCCAEKAKAELSPAGFDYLVATLANDGVATERLRHELAAPEVIEASTFMLHAPAQCAKPPDADEEP